ncbi:putative ankyrin repeat protein [Cotonvirus japonicus]|uniref:Ankyrin repeat protein n=1 Tax=Cotonvirus japonicus TaxID=2811091 RepID=A0ABM7NSB7_9VIRU|nr:putative ankyrin repeat protein [Cotonvirus japonicus]BCS83054.1 putative ankyrin repeat protein [Cotonvirus japonicus]
MSRYPSRIFINNPEKKVPDDLIEQFFLTIKTGDIDKIRNFVAQNKIKYNIIDEVSKNNAPGSDKTPIHTVLELDDKIADNDAKLKIIEFLDNMGAPIDFPDVDNIWPIHLAASLQSVDIINYLIKKHVSIDRKDSSNNTPLHYAIYGKETACSSSLDIKPLVPKELNNTSNNETLVMTKNFIVKLLGSDNKINNDLLHMINTLMIIPEMYSGSKIENELQTQIINIFTEASLNPDYQNNMTSLLSQEGNIEQLINKTYSIVNDDLLRGLDNPLNIAPNNGGWGPQIPTETGPRYPTDIEQIMKNNSNDLIIDVNNKYNQEKNSILNVNITTIDKISRETLPNVINQIDTNYIDTLIFCPDCRFSSYGENIGLIKMLYLLVWNNYKSNYSTNLANKIMNDFVIMSKTIQSQIINNNYLTVPAYSNLAVNDSNSLIGYLLGSLLSSSNFSNKTETDQMIEDVVDYIDPINPLIPTITTGENSCITLNLLRLFTNSDDPNRHINLFNTTLNQPLSNILSLDDFEQYTTEFNSLRLRYRNPANTWFTVLLSLIREIKPVLAGTDPKDITNNIFVTNTARGVNFILPLTPLPNSQNYGPPPTAPRGTLANNYTFYEMFAIIDALYQFINTKQMRITKYPDIFNQHINNWIEYIDDTFQNNIQLQQFPELMFLHKILVTFAQQEIRKIIKNCIELTITRATNTTIQNPLFDNLKNIFKPLNDAYMYNLLLPAIPQSEEFNIEDEDPYFDLKQHNWDNDNNLITWFNDFIKNRIPIEFINHLGEYMFDNYDDFSYKNLNNIRNFIETDSDNINTVSTIIKIPKFRNSIKEYFGTYVYPKKFAGTKINNQMVLNRYNKITREIELENIFDIYLSELTNGNISQLLFLTEIYNHTFVIIKQRLIDIQSEFNIMNGIISDIISNINNGTYYYIPQIFLPALIKYLLLITTKIITIKSVISDFQEYKSKFINFVDITIDENNLILELGNNFENYIDTQLQTIYQSAITIINYHNNVINFLNYHSAHQLITSRTGNTDKDILFVTNFFTKNLVPINDFPNNLSNLSDNRNVINIFNKYSIPEIIYYADPDESNRINYDVFDVKIDTSEDTPSYFFDNYKNVISYTRSGKLSNSPLPGENTQLNITVNDDGTGNLMYNIIDINNPINGRWLNFDKNDFDNTDYLDAFIAYFNKKYQLEWKNGMPPSIYKMVNNHLGILKQKIVEDVIQYIINNKNDSTKELYMKINDLGTQKIFNNIGEVKNYIVIGKLTDEILNKIIEYSLRQSISVWIQSFITTDKRFSSISTTISRAISTLQHKDYSKLSLKEIDQTSIDELLDTNSKYLDTQSSQFETDSKNLIFTSKKPENKFIHHLYNINYVSDNTSNSTCYYTNPDIVSKLIDGFTINAKNSDGNTPLHLAMTMYNPKLIKLLINEGAKPFGFKNIRGQTPYDLYRSIINDHLSFTKGETISDSINNFVVPFNDLLVERLRDDKFGGNIIKNITMGIPIRLIMYNHMFHIFMENYRYGYTNEIRNSIRLMLKKYFKLEDTVYPTDLFDINSLELTKILEKEYPKKLTKKSSKTKISNYYKKQIIEIDNQINNLIKERRSIVDSSQISLINNIITDLEARKSPISKNIDEIEPDVISPPIDSGLISSYQSSVKSISTKINTRNLDLTEFYKDSFGRISKNNDLNLEIWNNYLNKLLLTTPSMIFPLLDRIIGYIIFFFGDNYSTPEIKQELSTIINFYKLAKNYINSKNYYPNNLDENPVLKQEYDQMIYLINLIITPSIKNILFKQIYSSVNDITKTNSLLGYTDTTINDQDKIMDEIINTQYNGQTLNTYIDNILPGLAVKYFTTAYNSTEGDNILSKSEDLFLPIIQILKQNKTLSISDDSTLVQNINEYLIPFFINTYQNFIHHIMLTVYAYERYILNTYQLVKTLQFFTKNK